MCILFDFPFIAFIRTFIYGIQSDLPPSLPSFMLIHNPCTSHLNFYQTKPPSTHSSNIIKLKSWHPRHRRLSLSR